MRSLLWPDMTPDASLRWVRRGAFWSVATTGIALLVLLGRRDVAEQVGVGAIDIGVGLLLAFGIWRRSRVAAAGQCVYWAYSKISQASAGLGFVTPIAGLLLFGWVFLNAARAVFAIHASERAAGVERRSLWSVFHGRERLTGFVASILLMAGIAALFRFGGRGDAVPTSPDAVVPLDPEVETGRLANGVTYYVRANHRPRERAELRLVIDAGSVFEAGDQRGLAHALEHMVFRGTTRFPGHRATEFMQAMGMRMGHDINGSTSFDETTYQLSIPTDRAGALDTAITILAEWAHAATFDTVEARQEAGVVFEEWRAGRTATMRMTRARNALMLAGSSYADRAPIGDTTVLRRFDLEAMRRFYREWYRPELMSVIVVGDVDPLTTVSLIRRRFGQIAASTPARPRPRVPVPPRHAQASVLTDAEATTTQVALWYAREHAPGNTVADFRALLVEELMRDILDERLRDASDRSDAPLLNAGVSVRTLVRSREAHVVGGAVPDERLPDAIAALAEVVAELQRFGPTEDELRIAKDAILEDRREDDAYGYASDWIAEALIWHHLHGDFAAGPSTVYELTSALLEPLTARDVAASASQLVLDRANIIVTTRASAGAPPVTTADLRAVARSAVARVVARDANATAAPVTLLERAPSPGTIASEKTHGELEVFEWTLGNGMRVLVKPTRFSDGDIEMRLTGPGGASLAGGERYPSAFIADRVLEATGVGPLTGSALSRLLARLSVDVSPYVDDDLVQINAEGPVRAIETMFQVAHLYFVAPRADSAAFRRYQDRSRAFARDREANPEAAFNDSVASRSGRHPRDIAGTRAFADAVRLRDAIGFWSARTANASNFTAVIVGDVSLERLRPLVRTYLASLPPGRRETTLKRHESTGATVTSTFRRGLEPKARTEILLSGVVDLTPDVDDALRMSRSLIESAVDERLRELMGGTYDVSVDLSVQPASRARYVLDIDFTAAPDRIDTLASVALAEIERLASSGPSDTELATLRAAVLSDLESSERSNSFWTSEMDWHSQRGWPLRTIAERRTGVEIMSAAALRAAVRQYFTRTHQVQVTRYPETGRDPAIVIPAGRAAGADRRP
jgi:zinc protease